jgi:hypothetical protein
MPSRKCASGESSGIVISIFLLLPHVVPSGGWVARVKCLVRGCECSIPGLAGVIDIAGTVTGAWSMVSGLILEASIGGEVCQRDQKGEHAVMLVVLQGLGK